MPKTDKEPKKESGDTPTARTKEKSLTPAAIDTIWERIEKWLEKNSPPLFERLLPGASEKELKEFETKTGLKLPVDYRASLKRHNGDVSLNAYTYSRLGSVQNNWEMMNDLDKQGKFKKKEIEGTGAGKIKPLWWNEAWIPFAEDSAGNMLCLDTDPGKRGLNGQVLFMELQTGPQVSKFRSFGEWLERFKKDLNAGKYEAGEDGFLIERSSE